jgi:hypothetical protein
LPLVAIGVYRRCERMIFEKIPAILIDGEIKSSTGDRQNRRAPEKQKHVSE